MKREVFLKQITGLFDLYNRKASKLILTTYWNALNDIPEDKFLAGIRKIVKNRTTHYVPTPGEIREAALGSSLKRAEIAWHYLLQALQVAGSSEDLHFDDPKLSETVHILGGWPHLCNMDHKDLNILRNEFIKLYIEVEGRDVVLHGISYLRGDDPMWVGLTEIYTQKNRIESYRGGKLLWAGNLYDYSKSIGNKEDEKELENNTKHFDLEERR